MVKVMLRSKKRRKFFTVPLPDWVFDFDLDKISLNSKPYVPMAQRLAFTILDLLEEHKKIAELPKEISVKTADNSTIQLEYDIYEGKKKDIVMESWEKGKHCIVSAGKKYYCPCVINQTCVMKTK